MKKSEIKIGRHYAAKVSGKMATVRIDAENPRGGWDATNMRTNKKIRIRSPHRLRHETRAPGKAKKIAPEEAKAIHKADQENARLAEERAKGPDGQTASERAMAQSATRAKKTKKATKVTKPATKRDTGEPAAKGGKKNRSSGLDAAAKVLADAKGPLGAKDMVEQMLAKGLWQTKGKTPAATIYAAIIREIATKGSKARFRKVERGKFELTR